MSSSQDDVSVKIGAKFDELIAAVREAQSLVQESFKSIEGSVTSASKSMTGSLAESARTTTERIDSMAEATEGASGAIGKMHTLLGVGAVFVAAEYAKSAVKEIIGLMSDWGATARDLQSTSAMFGFTTSQLQTLNSVAEMTGVGADHLFRSFLRLNDEIRMARDGSRESADALAVFGITGDMLADKNFQLSDAVGQVVKHVHEQGLSSKTTAEITDLFGIRAGNLATALVSLGGDMENLGEIGEDLNALTQQQIDVLSAYDSLVGRLGTTWDNTQGKMASVVAGTLLAMNEQFAGVNEQVERSITLGEVMANVWRIVAVVINTVIGVLRLAWTTLTGTISALMGLAAVAARLLVLDFDGAKQAWESYGKDVENIVSKVKNVIAENALASHNILMGEVPGLTRPKTGAGGAGGNTNPEEAAHKRSLEIAIEYERLKLDAVKKGSAEHVAVAERILAMTIERYGRDTTEFFSALKVREAALRAHAEEQQRFADEMSDGMADYAKAFAREAEASLEEIGRAAGDHLERTMAQQRQWADYIARQHEEAQNRIIRGYQRIVGAVSSAMSSSMHGVMVGLQTLDQAMLRIGDAILSSFIDMIVEMGEQWLMNQIAMTAATTAGAATRGAVEEAAGKKSVATSATTAMKFIATKAAETMASAYAAIAAIPVVGPFLAPAAAIAAGAAVIGFIGKIASAEGGYDIPGGTNPMTQLHEREMVLPAHLADRIRNMTDGGGGRGSQLTINALDARSVERVFRRNGPQLVRTLERQMRGMPRFAR